MARPAAILHWLPLEEEKRIIISIWAPTYASPNPTLTLTCCQLTVVELGEG